MYLPRELREESEGQEDQEATKEMGPHHHLVLVIMMAQIAEVSLMASISSTFAWHSSAMLGWRRRYALIISVRWYDDRHVHLLGVIRRSSCYSWALRLTLRPNYTITCIKAGF